MKKITFLFCLMLISFGYAQTDLETFEGAPPTLAIANATAGTAANIVANPDASMGSGNESATVLEFITGDAGDPWQQAELTLQGDYIDLTPGTDSTIEIDVYSLEAFDVLVRLTDGVVSSSDGTPVADTAADAIHTGNGWETLEFDFNDPQDTQGSGQGIYGRVFIFNLWDANDAGSGAGAWSCNPFGAPSEACPATTRYYDNINGTASPRPETCSDGLLNNGETEIDCGGPNCAPCPSPPTTGAPTPPNRAPGDVISFFSDAYNDITVDTFDTPWCGNTTTEVMVDGNPTKLTAGAQCEGVDWQSSRVVDASSMTHFHMDFYTDEADLVGKVFNLKFSQWSDDNPANDPDNGERSALELAINTGTTPAIVTGSWVSIDVEIDATFTNNLRRDDIVQFVITTNLPNVWYDNLYLHNNITLSTQDFETTKFRTFPNPTNGDWNISGNAVVNSVKVYDILGKEVLALKPNSNDFSINASSLKTGVYFAKIEGANSSKTIKLVRE
ncbi:T9SS type A sorting domain-containing protein [uncultured Winogradskyella sp.]|uniref:T9SS type A sorting domain-containing protein n=1 Tax=uncultured Winogradskyella sp. TaxID=395353 RepID=UPI002620D641|nr:T9SS type A sorting domain-containing protein [uncultured Winogradskyella sp.]